MRLSHRAAMGVPTVLHRLVPTRLTPMVLVNLFFAFLAVVGQVGVNVSLPLWTGSTQLDCGQASNATNGSNRTAEGMDPYFVLSFSSLSFLIISGGFTLALLLAKLILRLVKPDLSLPVALNISKEDLKFPQWQFALIGAFSALNGVLVVAASLPDRTAPFLQAILGNFTIPLTITFRFIILRHKPTLLKLSCALMVVLGLILSLIPNITGMDQGSSVNSAWSKQSYLSRTLWPLCFMLGYVPAALMNVIEEKSLKDTRSVNLFFLLLMASLYQVLTASVLFWTDFLPGFGYTDSIHEFGHSYWFALKCFFGHADCGYTPGLRGLVFVVMFATAYIGGGLLIRYAEGATYLAIVQALVTPLGALFWSLFNYNDCGKFFWGPHANSLTYFSIGGIAIMVPAIYLYNIGTFDRTYQKCICYCIDLYPVRGKHYSEDEEDGEVGNEQWFNPRSSVQHFAESGDETTPLLLHDTSRNKP